MARELAFRAGDSGEQLAQELEKLLEAQRGLCVINFYQREMADAAAFREMARRCGRTLALEPETAYVAWRFFGEPVHVYIPDNERFAPGGSAAGAAWYRELLANNPTVTLEQLRAAPQAYVVQNSYENLLELFSLPDAQGSYLHAGGPSAPTTPATRTCCGSWSGRRSGTSPSLPRTTSPTPTPVRSSTTWTRSIPAS